MRWFKKKWARYAMLALIALQLIIVTILNKYGYQITTILVVTLAYCLLFLVFLWIYYKYPDKFED
jgi:Flp pilus assembly protein TadB